MIKIAIVEDHTLFRKGIRSLLNKVEDFEIIGEYANGEDFLDDLFNCNADVVLMDIEMPVTNGIDATKEARLKKKDLKILALSMYSDKGYYYEMIKAGASGFVLKEASPEELEKAIRDVNDGLGFFSPKLLQQAIIKIPEIENQKTKANKLNLSEREIEVLDLICKGLTNHEISEKLFLSQKTIESHKTRIMRKTQTKNTASLIIYAFKNELVKI